MGEVTVGQWLWCEYIFTIFANISIPIEKGVTLHMNKLESSLTNLKIWKWTGQWDENMKSLHTEWITRGWTLSYCELKWGGILGTFVWYYKLLTIDIITMITFFYHCGGAVG